MARAPGSNSKDLAKEYYPTLLYLLGTEWGVAFLSFFVTFRWGAPRKAGRRGGLAGGHRRAPSPHGIPDTVCDPNMGSTPPLPPLAAAAASAAAAAAAAAALTLSGGEAARRGMVRIKRLRIGPDRRAPGSPASPMTPAPAQLRPVWAIQSHSASEDTVWRW